MTDREKVISGLEHCANWSASMDTCDECPYGGNGVYGCAQLARDALALLKAIRRELLKEEVVRCKDCIHLPTYDDEGKLQFPWDSPCPCVCSDTYYAWRPADDWFCANGERKEAQEDAVD